MMRLYSLFFALALAVATPSQERGWLGVMLDELSERPAVAEVIPDSPAERAGVRPGDVFEAIDGRETPSVEVLVERIQRLRAGQRVELRLRRDGEVIEVEVRLAPRPADRWAEPPGAAEPAPVVEAAAERSASVAAGFATSLPVARRRADVSGKPVLAVFGAPWCAASRALQRALTAPELAGVLRRYEPAWIDVGSDDRLVERLGIDEIPHLAVLGAGGSAVAGLAGFRPSDALGAFLTEHAGVPEASAPAALPRLRREIAALRDELRDVRALIGRIAAERRR